jgi:hypothetical protein
LILENDEELLNLVDTLLEVIMELLYFYLLMLVQMKEHGICIQDMQVQIK